MSLAVRTKRIYDRPGRGDRYRALIDHVWPRGVSRERARLDQWARELPPAMSFANGFAEFRARYRGELATQSELVDELRRHAASRPLTVLYAAREGGHNNVGVL